MTTNAIVGSGAIGSAIASHFARTGIDVLLANSRGPESLTDLVGRLGSHVQAVPMSDALGADIVILALPFTSIPLALGNLGDWAGRIVVDCTNAIDFPAFTPTNLGGRPSSEVMADLVPGALVVKAFNTLPAAVLAAHPEHDGGRRVLFVSGNVAEASAKVSQLIERLGFAAIDLGKLSGGGLLQQFGGPLTDHNLVKFG